MKSITVTIIKGTGQAKVETSGFTGGECMKATANLKAALGNVTAETPKPELYAVDTIAEDATR